MMHRRKYNRLIFLAVLFLVMTAGCSWGQGEEQSSREQEDLIVVGVSQVGSESVWRTANTASIQDVFTRENGYFLMFDNARQKQENQIRAVRRFISQRVDYIVISPIVETGWDTVFREAKEAGIQVVLCETQKADGKTITDEMVKEVFDACKFDAFIELCGHPYIMIGEVEHGKALGRTVGMPTANLSSETDKIKPLDGVYATVVHVDDEVYKSMTNIGKRPSVDDFDYVTIEAFILDFARDIYGKTLVLEVHQFVRGVQKFANLEEVQKQVQKDIQKVREVLENAVNENN